MGGRAGASSGASNRIMEAAFSSATKPQPRHKGLLQRENRMTERDFEAKLVELDRLLNDPEIRMDPDRIWTILAEISGKDIPMSALAQA